MAHIVVYSLVGERENHTLKSGHRKVTVEKTHTTILLNSSAHTYPDSHFPHDGVNPE